MAIAAGSGKPRVAAIDDDHGTLRLVSLALGAEFEVTEYQDPRTALEAFAAGEIPDLVISDVMMPQMVGFDLHERARALPQMRSVPFLFLSAMSDRVHQRRGMSQGADDYITKPFKAAELRDAVHVRLQRAGSLREEASSEGVLEIASLGGLSVRFAGRRLQWEARNAALLLMNLLRSGRSAPLRELQAALWSEPVQSNTVRVLINRARRMLDGVGEIPVRSEVAHLELRPAVHWDALQFEDAAVGALARPEPKRIEAALGLYTGEFMPDFEGPWVEEQRGHFENLYLELLEAAVEVAAGEAEREAAQARLDAWYGN